VYGYGSFRRS